jgi:dTDP-4-amino-4,6-dideoxygalactose transaminase
MKYVKIHTTTPREKHVWWLFIVNLARIKWKKRLKEFIYGRVYQFKYRTRGCHATKMIVEFKIHRTTVDIYSYFH